MPGPNGNGYAEASIDSADESRLSIDSALLVKSNPDEWVFAREGELMSKLHQLLHSPFGQGVAEIILQLHGILPMCRSSI